MDIRSYPQFGNAEDIDCLVTHTLAPGLLEVLPKLELLYAVGAGVDYLLEEARRRPGLKVARIVDDAMSADVATLAVAATLSWVRDLPSYARQQDRLSWAPLPHRSSSAVTVGILGMGRIGTAVSASLTALGFNVCGWSRTAKEMPGVQTFAGASGLRELTRRAQVLICTLPLTDETAFIINEELLAAMPVGAYFVNVGRGQHVDEEALLRALDKGSLSGAFLDVFAQEPLPGHHPFWRHPRVQVTPHVASRTLAGRVAPQVLENVRRLRAGQPLMNLVDPSTGY